MDLPLDPAPYAVQPPAASAIPSFPNPPPAPNHPPYSEMITSAISALNEPNGSSKRAIAQYIESQYLNLSPTHSELLTEHIKQLKSNGQLVMIKYCYKLPVPGSAPVVPSNGAVNAVPSDPASHGTKKRRGRPPKAVTESLQAAVPVFGETNAAPVIVPLAAAPPSPSPNITIGPVDGTVKRGRGRPPKTDGGTPVTRVAASSGKGRGRPKRVADSTAAQVVGSGRPPKPINVDKGPVAAPSATPVAGKRRGRPPRADSSDVKKPRKLSGKPVGRPKKSTASPSVAHNPNAYLDLKGNHDNLKYRILQAAVVIKPCLSNEAAIIALHELEQLASVNNDNAPPPPNAPIQQPQEPEPVQQLQPSQ